MPTEYVPIAPVPLLPMATAALETALNTLVRDNPDHARSLTRLKGQVLQVHLKEPDQSLIFVFSQQVDVLGNYEGEPDCRLSLNLSVLPELRDHNNITRLIKEEKLELEGDLKLAQGFSQLLEDIRPDPEEWLSRYTGDIVAHTMAQGARDLAGWLKSQARKHESHLAQVLTEEWQIAPPPLAVAHFCDQVSDIKSEVDRLEARFNRLTERL